MKKQDKDINNDSFLKVIESIKNNDKFMRFSFLVFVLFIIFMLVFCFTSAIINKDVTTAFITVMVGTLIYTLLVLIQNEKNLTTIINKSIKMHRKSNIVKKADNEKDKDFIILSLDFLVSVTSFSLILILIFFAFLNSVYDDILSTAILILLIIFMAMLLYFWTLIQHNNKISVNIKQNKLKNIYKKSGVHLKFDNNKIKKKIKLKTKKNSISKIQK